MPASTFPSSDRIRDAFALALGVYPLFVGIYTAGLFWDLPTDAISAFSFSDIVFKSSVIYTSIAAIVLFYVLAISILYVIIPQSSGNTEPYYTHEKWQDLSLNRRLYVLFSMSLSVIFFSFLFFEDPPGFKINPYMIAGSLIALFVIGLPIRFFVREEKWRIAVAAYGSCWLIVAPLTLGYSDSLPDRESPIKKLGNTECRVVFIGSQSLLANCTGKYALLQRSDDKTPLVWNDKLR